MSRPQQRPYTLGFLGTMAIVSALIIFMYGTTFESGVQATYVSAVVFLVVGLVFAYTMVGVVFQPFDLSGFMDSLIWACVSVTAIWMVNMSVPFTLTVTPLSNKLFSVLMGVAEECFFRLWMVTFIHKFTGSSILAVGVSSGIWTTYHIARYAGQPSAFFVVFVAGLILGFVMLYSKRADGVIFAHAIVNFLAVS